MYYCPNNARHIWPVSDNPPSLFICVKLGFCTMFKNDVNDMFNYVCKDILIDNFEYMTVEYKWQVILTDSGYTDFNMWVRLGCKIASRMFDLLKKMKALCRGD